MGCSWLGHARCHHRGSDDVQQGQPSAHQVMMMRLVRGLLMDVGGGDVFLGGSGDRAFPRGQLQAGVGLEGLSLCCWSCGLDS